MSGAGVVTDVVSGVTEVDCTIGATDGGMVVGLGPANEQYFSTAY